MALETEENFNHVNVFDMRYIIIYCVHSWISAYIYIYMYSACISILICMFISKFCQVIYFVQEFLYGIRIRMNMLIMRDALFWVTF